MRIPERLLLGPGPSPVSPRVMQAMASPVISHLDPAMMTVAGTTSGAVSLGLRRRRRGVQPRGLRDGYLRDGGGRRERDPSRHAPSSVALGDDFGDWARVASSERYGATLVPRAGRGGDARAIPIDRSSAVGGRRAARISSRSCMPRPRPAS